MAEFICYPERLLHRIPESMTWDQAVMVEPTANVVTDLLEHTGVMAGDVVAIQGPGPIGLLAAMAARAAGARDVALIGAPGDAALRFTKARELGFHRLIDIGKADPVASIQALTGGLGADIVVECSGAPRAIALLAALARKQGKICAIGLTGNQSVTVPWDQFAFKVLEVYFNLSTSYTSWDRSIHLISSGALRAEKLITHRAPLVGWQGAFDAVENLEALKAVIVFPAA
jgi:L-iditol 2-dehydrogenase